MFDVMMNRYRLTADSLLHYVAVTLPVTNRAHFLNFQRPLFCTVQIQIFGRN